jgi:putative ABC transport system permease protein
VKIKPDDLPGSMQLLRSVWKQVAPNQDFKGSFLDENIDRQYRREEKLGKIFVYGAIIAILLSCMGLLAMVILMIAQRVKEIGIRKVLGASAAQIVAIVSKDFLVLVLLAFVIAAPIAWLFMKNWLQDFAYRIDIHWWVFAEAGICAALIALITICLQAIRAALANPVKSLRAE